ncbi:hypothetical protein DSL72_002131 [Monilinia vaccinii-corymbosi]|uniref:Major facilitator superfamily (MFS) profile domain-containing protein n=1 Tax=Monilinia vaccinii-corymbosi TaxID=61207 RepID=A0A8A3PBT5_9HELO|nr:hypothetical protein DSL72_002131 [Monilinia vaccinii-corymbosi]
MSTHLPDTVAPPPQPLTRSDAEKGMPIDPPAQVDGKIAQPLRLPEPFKTVSWDGDSDQLNPINWSSAKRWANTAVISAMTFSTPLASTMFAPGVPLVMDEFRSTNRMLETLVVSIFVLGFAMGPLIAAPMSELYGRKPVYLASNFLFLVFTLACGLSTNLNMLIAFRFLAGCAGAAPTALGGASIGDMFPRDRRGVAMAIWGMGPLAGPILGPIVGGFLAEGAGWRWAFWLEAVIAGLTCTGGFFLLQETYPVVILETKTKRIITETGDTSHVSALHHEDSPIAHFTHAIVRPLKMLFLSPIVFLLSIYYAVLFGYLYLFITTFPTTFTSQYHFSISTTGLAYLGLGAGIAIGLFASGRVSDPLFRKLTRRHGGVAEPEFRLPALMLTSPLIAVAFLAYGWTAQVRIHWIVPILGTCFFGLGLIPAFLSINLYLVDSFPAHAASAIAATKVFQSIGGAFLPLAGPPLYAQLGLGWGNTVLGLLALGQKSFSASSYATFRPSYPPKLYHTILTYHHGPRNTLLDLGCGPGLVSRALAPHFTSVWGVDPSAGMIAQAAGSPSPSHDHDHDHNHAPNIQWRQGSAEDLSWVADGGLDMLVAGQAAHWFDFPRVWREVGRKLRKGGTLAFWGYADNVLVDFPGTKRVLESTFYGMGEEGMGVFWEQPGRERLRGLYADAAMRPPGDLFGDVRRVMYEPGVEGRGTGVGEVLMGGRLRLGELEGYWRTFSAFHEWVRAHPERRRLEVGGDGDVIDEMFLEILEVEPALRGGEGEDWRDVEVETEWGTVILLARKL